MALEYRVLFRTIVGLTSLETVVSYLNKYDKKYDHIRLQEAVLGCFKGRLLDELKTIADFQKTWFDLDRLVRVAIDTGLRPEHNQVLSSYCSAEDHGRWRGFGKTPVIDLGDSLKEDDAFFKYTNVFEGERGVKAIVSEVWEDVQIGLFSSVWDLVSGRIEVLECAVDDRFCKNLFLVEHGRQIYCGSRCRKAEGMRQMRLREKVGKSDGKENLIRV